MLDWLLAPIDPTRAHDLPELIAWHGRAMVLAWSFLVPAAIIAARYFKVMPGQDWPRKLDNKAWWHTHRGLHYLAGALTIAGIGLAAAASGWSGDTHALLGWGVAACMAVQILGGWLRGTKGGPTEPAPDGSLRGDHYDMTLRRRIFENVHKTAGYLSLGLAALAIATGLWRANAPVWMWITILTWWALLAAAFVSLQRGARGINTYQAIWGPGPEHPGNKQGSGPAGE